MIIACPKCRGRHDVSGRKPGETFTCSCGNVLRAPRGRSVGWIIALAVVVSLGVPCLLMAAIAVPNFIKFGTRSKASEARINLAAIRTAELAYLGTYDKFVAAGPVPAKVPGKEKAEFVPDDGFRTLAWTPEGRVYHQYEVRLTGPRSGVITAHGDVDGDGKVAEYTLEFSADGPRGEVKKADEDEY